MHMQHAMTMRWKGRETAQAGVRTLTAVASALLFWVWREESRQKEKTKRGGEKESTPPTWQKVNIIQFITLKEKRRVLNVILHVSDLGSVVYHLKFCARLEKYVHIKAALLKVTSLARCGKWGGGVSRKDRFCSQCRWACGHHRHRVKAADEGAEEEQKAALLVTWWLLLPWDTCTGSRVGPERFALEHFEWVNVES